MMQKLFNFVDRKMFDNFKKIMVKIFKHLKKNKPIFLGEIKINSIKIKISIYYSYRNS